MSENRLSRELETREKTARKRLHRTIITLLDPSYLHLNWFTDLGVFDLEVIRCPLNDWLLKPSKLVAKRVTTTQGSYAGSNRTDGFMDVDHLLVVT